VGFPAEDIIWSQYFPVATGMDEHKLNALDFSERQNGLEKSATCTCERRRK
jgi:cobalamin-dependent methionine synthase I